LCAGVVAGTWFITPKIATTLHLDHNIGLNKRKLNLLVNDNTAECNVSQEKRNYHETMHDGAIGIKENFQDSSIYMKNQLAGFFKTSQESRE